MGYHAAVARFKRQLLELTLEMHDGNRTRTAKALGLERTPDHVAIPYKGHWFYILETDHVTKATFSLLLEIVRLELTGKSGQARCSPCP